MAPTGDRKNTHAQKELTSRRSAFAHADTPRNTSPDCISCASAPSPAAARRREHRTSPGCRPCRSLCPRQRRLALKRTLPRAPASLAHADARRETPRRDAGLQISRPRCQGAQKMSQKTATGLAASTKGFECSKALVATMKKPFAWVPQGVLGTNLARPGAPDCLPRGRMTDLPNPRF